jgi:hypothetical protein
MGYVEQAGQRAQAGQAEAAERGSPQHLGAAKVTIVEAHRILLVET